MPMVSIEQIAKRAGVSKMTVSRVLNSGREVLRPDAVARARRIRQIAEELGYRPNSIAQTMRSGRFNCVGVIGRAQIGPQMHYNLIKGVMRELSPHNMHVTVGDVEYDRIKSPAETPKILRELCADGTIVHYAVQMPPEVNEMITSQGSPVVLVNTDGEHDCVYPDDEGGSRLAVERLVEAGHRRIVFLDQRHPVDQRTGVIHYSGAARLRGFKLAARKHGIEPVVYVPASEDHHALIDEFTRWLSAQAPCPTALICANERKALALLVAAGRCGLTPGRDLVILPFSGGGLRDVIGPLLAEIVTPMIAVGHEAARMMLEKIEDPHRHIPSRAVPYTQIGGRGLAIPQAR